MNYLLKQIIKFGIVGFLAFLIDYSLLYILTEYFKIYYLYSSIISFIISLIFNYIASIKWVFKVNQQKSIENIIIFTILSIIGLIINQVIMYIMVEIINIWYMFSKLFSTIMVMIFNFITRKKFIEKN